MRARWYPNSLPVGRRAASQARVGARPPGLDPQWRWAVHTQWRGFANLAQWHLMSAEEQRIQVIVQAPEGMNWEAFDADPVLGCKTTAVAPAYRTARPKQARTRHFTATLPLQHADALVNNPFGLRWKLAMPLRDAQRSNQASPKGLFGPDRDAADMQVRNQLAAIVAAARAAPNQPASPLPLAAALAVIDFGCPFLHRSLLREDLEAEVLGTRVRALWDQGSEPGHALANDGAASWPWTVPGQWGRGRELSAHMLDMITRAAYTPGGFDETRVYRGIDHLIDRADPRRRVWRATHGGHVLSTVGGAPEPLSGAHDQGAGADLVFVQLPSLTAMDSSGGSLAAHLLDGVRYAMGCVQHGGPLVVVISYGNSAGPHDGSSLIECAFEELLAQRPDNFAIVLAGGNARREGGHTARIVRRDRSALLRLQLVEGDTTDSFVEIWYPNAGPALEVRMRGPGRVWSEWTGHDQEQLMRDGSADQEVVAMIRHDKYVPNGDGAHVLLAFAPTAQPAGVDCRLCEAGLWEIELRLAEPAANAEVAFEAWIERDDPAGPNPGPRSRFVDLLRDDEGNTASSIANGASTIKAFGFNLESGRPAPYSSLPRLPLPPQPEHGALQVMAACEEDRVQPDLPGAATRSDDKHRMKGTSVAAPVLARQLFAVMAGGQTIGRADWPGVLADLIDDQALPTVQRLVRD
ncbi:hypothetical protein [Aquabacterium sp.]|uniref:hypothetical protein n=1 Tax=Aquabacterium sp. TaxID=1872578 RepID=UPI002C684CFC|nr:hypothetical protein [Aquabacterium sp.]HSW06020.1 hypothetical protein [Aquabacterium sp.]